MKPSYFKIALFILWIFMGTTLRAQHSNVLQIPDLTVKSGATLQLPVQVNNSDPFVAMQFDITLPEGFSLSGSDATTTNRCTDHSVTCRLMSGKTWRCMVFSNSNTSIAGQSGTVVNLAMTTQNNLTEGSTHTVTLSNCSLSAADGSNILTGTSAGTMLVAKLPDLTIENISSTQSSLTPGGHLSLQWMVNNIGDYNTEDGWNEQISLVSSDGSTKKLLTTLWNADVLAANSSVSRSTELDLPKVLGMDGDVYVQIKIVPTSATGEPVSAQGNNTAQTTTSLTLSKLLTLQLSGTTVTEKTSPTLSCTLSRSGSWASAETYSLIHTSDSRISMPTSLEIPAGQSAQSFQIHITDDDQLQDNSRNIVITATGNDYPNAHARFELVDDELPSLTLTPSSIFITEGESQTFTIQAERNVKEATTVNITCDFPTSFEYPSSVTIAANSNSATFTITAKDNDLPSLDKDITFKVSADRHQEGECTILLKDNDMPVLSLTISPTTVKEDAGTIALTGVLRRSTNKTSKITVKLTDDSNDGLYFSTKTLVMEKNVEELTFNFGPVDNNFVDGDRTYTVTAAVYISDCSCSASGESAGSVSATVDVLDNDGPSLGLSASSGTVKEGSNVTLTVSRNSDTSTALTCQLSSDHDEKLDYPHTVVIPAGASSVTIEVTALSNSISDDSQVILFTANAASHSAGTCNVMVTDQSLPDAKITDISASETDVIAGGTTTITLTVLNDGSTTLSTEIPVTLYIQGTSTSIGKVYVQTALAPGESTTLQKSITMPTETGTVQVYGIINEDKKVKELNYTNNRSENCQITVTPPYTALVTTDKTVYNQGDKITLNGTVSGLAAPGSQVEIYLINSGARQTIMADIVENAFSATYTLYESQIGHFVAGACYPGAKETSGSASFNVYGMKLKNKTAVECDVTLGDTKNGTIEIENPSELSLTNVKATLVSVPDEFDVTLDIPNAITGGSTVSMNYSVTGKSVSPQLEWYPIEIELSSSEGASLRMTIYAYCRNTRGSITSNVKNIVATVTKDYTREYPIEIINNGQGSTGDIKLSLPNWITSTTGNRITPLNQGESTTITLVFNPTEDMQLNMPVTGTIGINCTNGNGLAINYQIEVVSEATGFLQVDVVDEYTYNTEEAPHVANAHVVVKHPYTDQILAEGLTDSEGTYTFELNEGYYIVEVSAEKHNTFTNYYYVNPGKTESIIAFIGYNPIDITWEMEETEVEDEYTIDLKVTYETNVPMPVVKIGLPERIDGENMAIGDATLITMTLTNLGLIEALNTKIILPTNSSEWKFEVLSHTEPFRLSPKSSVEVPILITRISDSSSGTKHRINPVNDFNNCMAMMRAYYEYLCGDDLKNNEAAEAMAMKFCAYSTLLNIIADMLPSGGGGSSKPGSGGGGGIIHIDPPTSTIVKTLDICDPCDAKRIKQMLDFSMQLLPIGEVDKALDKAIEAARKAHPNAGIEVSERIIEDIRDQMIDHAADQLVEGGGKLVELCIEIYEYVTVCDDDKNSTKSYRTDFKSHSSRISQHSWVNEFDDAAYQYIDEVNAIDNFMLLLFGDKIWYEEADDEKLSFMRYISSLPLGSNPSDEELVAHKPSSVSLEQMHQYVNYRNGNVEGYITSENLYSQMDAIEASEDAAKANGYGNVTEQFLAAHEIYKQHYEDLKSNSVCATISLKFSQRMTMTRQAFLGTLKVFNGHETTPMTNVRLVLDVRNSSGELATSNEFQIDMQSMNGFEGTMTLDGGWTLPANGTGEATIQFIPTKFAAPETSEDYSFGGSLIYTDPFTGLEVTRTLIPITMTVNPCPELDLHYFVQRDIIGDDPLTEDIVEPCKPAEFALLINNKGYGDATNVRMLTSQPVIEENLKGLMNRFFIESSQLNGSEKTLTLGESTASEFGTIKAQSQAYAQWWLHSDYLGHFTSYEASYNHVSSHGNENLSLLDEVKVHKLIHGFTTKNTENKQVRGFLVNDLPDATDTPDGIFFTDATQSEVSIATGSLTQLSSTTYRLSVTTSTAGWNYGSLIDPTNGRQELISIVLESDDTELFKDNLWMTDRTLRDGEEPLYENRLHFILEQSTAGTTTYLLTMTEKPTLELAVSQFEGVTNGEKKYGPVGTINVVFNKSIDPATFTTEDLDLICQGEHLSTTGIGISTSDNITFAITLGSEYDSSGYYELTVQTAGITDDEGFNGYEGKSVNWLQFSSVQLTITDIGIATLILPFTDWARDGMQLFSCEGNKSSDILDLVENDEVKAGERPIFTAYDFEQYSDELNNRPLIMANTPYLIKGVPGTYTFWGMWEPPTTTSYTVGWLTGVLEPTLLVASEGNNQYVLQYKNGKSGFFVVDRDDITVPAYKVYLTVPTSSSANIRSFFFEEEATRILEGSGDVTVEAIYDLSGIRQSKLQKGVNILRMNDGSTRKVFNK